MAIDTFAAQLALRNRALALVAYTTGSTSLSVTTTGYARASGSFVTDGFKVGMEILASGFTTTANNGQGVIRAVAAGSMTVDAYTVTLGSTGYTAAARTLATEAAAAGRTVAVGLPAMRAWEDFPFTPVAGKPFLEEDFVPATHTLMSAPASGGEIEETGLYVLKWYGLSGVQAAATRKCVDALKARFTPGTNITAGSHTLRCGGNPAAWAGQLMPHGDGWSVVTLTVPWWAQSTNTIAA